MGAFIWDVHSLRDPKPPAPFPARAPTPRHAMPPPHWQWAGGGLDRQEMASWGGDKLILTPVRAFQAMIHVQHPPLLPPNACCHAQRPEGAPSRSDPLSSARQRQGGCVGVRGAGWAEGPYLGAKSGRLHYWHLINRPVWPPRPWAALTGLSGPRQVFTPFPRSKVGLLWWVTQKTCFLNHIPGIFPEG